MYGFMNGFLPQSKTAGLNLSNIMDEDALRAMNAIAPAPASSTSGRPPPPRQTIELSEQTPLSGFDQKQTQIQAGAILDVGASIMKVGDQGRPRDAPSAPDSRRATAPRSAGRKRRRPRATTRTTPTRPRSSPTRPTRRRRALFSERPSIRDSSASGARRKAPAPSSQTSGGSGPRRARTWKTSGGGRLGGGITSSASPRCCPPSTRVSPTGY